MSAQLGLHRVQNVRDVFHVNDFAMSVEHLHEAAHVGALEFLGQVHIHADGGDGVLRAVRLVADLDGKTHAAHTDLVDADFAVVASALHVMQRFGCRAGGGL